MKNKAEQQGFTATEKETLYGLSQKVAKKHHCSNTYVRCIINGKRRVRSVLSQNIMKDLQTLAELLRPPP